jgi:hypothetical protein
MLEPTKPADVLQWRCTNGKEYTDIFSQPQRWKQLCEIAHRDRQDLLPQILRSDLAFGLLFSLAFPHRSTPSLIKHLDTLISRPIN